MDELPSKEVQKVPINNSDIIRGCILGYRKFVRTARIWKFLRFLFLGLVILSLYFFFFGFIGYMAINNLSFSLAFERNYDVIFSFTNPFSVKYPSDLYALVEAYVAVFFFPTLGVSAFSFFKTNRNMSEFLERVGYSAIERAKKELKIKYHKLTGKELTEKEVVKLAIADVFISDCIERKKNLI